MSWVRLRGAKDGQPLEEGDSYVKAHWVHKELLPVILADLVSRYELGEHMLEPISKIFVDTPGMAGINEHTYTLTLKGLDLTIPARSFEYMYEDWSGYTERSGGYYKFHFWNNRCLCVTPEQRKALLADMLVLLPEARAMCSAEADAFNQAFADSPLVLARPRPTLPKIES